MIYGMRLVREKVSLPVVSSTDTRSGKSDLTSDNTSPVEVAVEEAIV